MKFPEQFRWANAPNMPPTKAGEPYGCFRIPPDKANGRWLGIIATDGDDTGWEHVSVSLCDFQSKCPTWIEMCIVKDYFWGDEECVVQFHPRKKDYIDVHKACLHLWRCTNKEFPMPPKICV